MYIDTRQAVTIDTIKATNLLGGGKWFNKDTMRFFNSHVLPTVYKGKYFITHETNPSGVKRYSVREAIDGGESIETVGSFHSYESKEEAIEAIESI
jgi:hypothetical protein